MFSRDNVWWGCDILAGERKIGRSYTTSRWIWWYAEEWVIGCADKSKGLSLSAGRLDSVACARPRRSPSLNPEPCCSVLLRGTLQRLPPRTFLMFRRGVGVGVGVCEQVL